MQQNRVSGQSASSPAFAGSGAQWFPLQTRYQCERMLEAGLHQEGFESFSPMCHQVRRWSDRTKVVEAPLFPGYIFVRMQPQPELLVRVLRLPGMVRFVTSGRVLVPVPDEEIDTVRTLLRSRAAYEPVDFPLLGERVRIHGGCLDGVEGVLTAHTGRTGIIVSIGAIQKSLKVSLDQYQVERLTPRVGPSSCAAGARRRKPPGRCAPAHSLTV